ncbi:MAG: erythromycin esterase family protein [bacterium]
MPPRTSSLALVALLVALLVASAAEAQVRDASRAPTYDPLNLDLERAGMIAPDRPRKWLTVATGFDIALDSTVAHSGRRSVRSRAQATAVAGAMAELRAAAPFTLAAGKRVRLRAFIRTENLEHGHARLWIRADGPAGRPLSADTIAVRQALGATSWTPYEVTLVVDPKATGVVYGVTHDGDGTVWFDSFSLEVDGRSVASLLPAWRASPAEIGWLRAHAIPLTTTDPAAPVDELRPLEALIGDARVVALGEATHGTADFFQLKQRTVQYLVERKGFTVFALEATMPEARRIDDYVRTGSGDVRAALAGLAFPYWNSQEVLDIIEWMRRYNASGRGRVEFFGFDMQNPAVAMDSVRAFIGATEPGFLPALDSAYNDVRAVQAARRAGQRAPDAVRNWERSAASVLAHLEANRTSYASALPDSMRLAWAIQYARIALQGAQSALGGTAVRDSNMALNAAWIYAHHPAGTKMIVSSLDRHVQRVDGWMGMHLHRRFADSLRIVGTAFGEGTYVSNGARGLTAYPADPPAPGSVESAFRAAGLRLAALDLRGASRSAASRWLTQPHDLRIIGTMATDNAFAPARVAGDYDIMIYVDRTRASTLLSPPQSRP